MLTSTTSNTITLHHTQSFIYLSPFTKKTPSNHRCFHCATLDPYKYRRSRGGSSADPTHHLRIATLNRAVV